MIQTQKYLSTTNIMYNFWSTSAKTLANTDGSRYTTVQYNTILYTAQKKEEHRLDSGPSINIIDLLSWYRDSQDKDKTVVRLSHLYDGNPYIGKMTSLYRDAAFNSQKISLISASLVSFEGSIVNVLELS